MSTRLSAFLVTTAASSLTSLLGTLQPPPASHELVLRPTPSSDDEDEELSPRSLKPLTSVSTQLCLSTNCDQCGSAVSVQVPTWITEMMDTAGTGPKRANGGEEEDLLRRKEWREGIVQGAVSLAIAVKESPVRVPHSSIRCGTDEGISCPRSCSRGSSTRSSSVFISTRASPCTNDSPCLSAR